MICALSLKRKKLPPYHRVVHTRTVEVSSISSPVSRESTELESTESATPPSQSLLTRCSVRLFLLRGGLGDHETTFRMSVSYLGNSNAAAFLALRQWRAVPASVKALFFCVIIATVGLSSDLLASRTAFLSKEISVTPANF